MQFNSSAAGGDWALNRIRELEAALREIATLATYPNTLREIIATAHKALSQ